MRIPILFLLLWPLFASGQLYEDFSDGNFTEDPFWSGDTARFKITSSSAIPPAMKPALQLDGEGSDTSFLCTGNEMIGHTEWRFWVKLSFNTSANNFARVYLVSDQPDLKGSLNGYFVQLGGANDSVSLEKQTGQDTEMLICCETAFTGNSLNILRVKVTRDDSGLWKLYTDMEGGYDFVLQGEAVESGFTNTSFFGIFCKYTGSNATKFYYDDFYIGSIVNDTIPPSLSALEVISQYELALTFSEEIEQTSASDTLNYFVTEGPEHPVSAGWNSAYPENVALTFSTPFAPGVEYSLSIEGVSDLYGNTMAEETVSFIYSPAPPAMPYDVVIHEIMTDVNPPPSDLPEADYLELMNRTGDTLSLLDWTIRPRSSSEPLPLPGVSILPDSFLLVVNPSDTADFGAFGPVTGLQGFSMNNEGTIVLRNNLGDLISAVTYIKSWYEDEEKEEGGWSLEMSDPSAPCLDKGNWRASESSSGGTPGRRNSVWGVITTQPAIEEVCAIDNQHIRISFNHKMDLQSVSNPASYEISPDIGTPSDIVTDSVSFMSVILQLPLNLQTDSIYQLTIIDTLFNCAGAPLETETALSFPVPRQAEPYDVVISEIMADPSPPRGLPDYEYIEIFNRTGSWIRAEGWSLYVGTIQKELPVFMLGPWEYLIITDDDAHSIFSLFGNTVAIPAMGLTNSGEELALTDREGTIISIVAYNLSWYRDAEKQEGGWSLEMIDTGKPCCCSENWTASVEDQGGTPGDINSVQSVIDSPDLVRDVYSLDQNSIVVGFSEMMDTTSACIKERYTVEPGPGHPDKVLTYNGTLNQVVLLFNSDLLKRKIYTLEINSSLMNCTGEQRTYNGEKEFGIPEMAEAGDIVINEVLFNPRADGVDFVEIYNPSTAIIDLSQLRIGSVKWYDFDPPDTNMMKVSTGRHSLLPSQFMVLTVNPGKVREQYFSAGEAAFLSMSSMPSYNNDEGVVVFENTEGMKVDLFHYEEDMHYPLLHSREGVSLERVHYSRPSSDITNWHSASEDAGFATPGKVNSQFSDYTVAENPVKVEPEVFSPDNDGYQDLLNISYHFGVPGYTANILIFDVSGRLVRQLVNNTTLGAEGVFSWDGIADSGLKSPGGIYIVCFEAFDMNGNVKKYKKAAAMAIR